MSGKAEATCEKHRLSQPSTWCVADVWCGVALGSHQRPGLPRPPPRGLVAYKTEPEGPLRSPTGLPQAGSQLPGAFLPEGFCPVSAPPGVLEAHSRRPCERPLAPSPHRRPARAGQDGGRGLGGCQHALCLPVCLEWWTGAACCPLGGQGWGRDAPGCGCFPGVPASACYGGGTQPGRSLTPATQEPGPGLRAHATGYLLRTRHGHSLL